MLKSILIILCFATNLYAGEGVSIQRGTGGAALQPKTAFGELLVGQLSPQFQGSFEYTVNNTDLNTNTTVNGGTVTQASGMGIVT
jgi:hypothetical protein